MRESGKRIKLSQVPLAKRCKVKSAVPVDVKTKVSQSTAIQSKNHLAWYVPLNSKPSERKISSIPQIKWKCPLKFSLNTSWHVAAGERSHEAEAQKCREITVQEIVYRDHSVVPPSPYSSPDMEGGANTDNSEIPIIPIIPIEAEMPSDTSPLADICIKSQPSKGSSVSENHKSLGDILHGLESLDKDVALAAAATFATVMLAKEQIDTRLLIEFLADPEMVKKLIVEHGKTANSEHETPPPPAPEEAKTPSPLPSSPPASVLDDNKLSDKSTEPLSRSISIASNSKPQKPNQSLSPSNFVPQETVKKLILEHGKAASFELGNPPEEADPPSPLPSSAPALVVDDNKLSDGSTEPLSRSISIPSDSKPQEANQSLSPPCSKVKKAINKSANKQGESKSARKLNPLAKPKSVVPPIKKLTIDSRRIAEVKKVRGPLLMPSNLRPGEETIEKLIVEHGKTANSEHETPPEEANTPPPLPSSTPASVVEDNKLSDKSTEPLSKLISSNSTPQKPNQSLSPSNFVPQEMVKKLILEHGKIANSEDETAPEEANTPSPLPSSPPASVLDENKLSDKSTESLSKPAPSNSRPKKSNQSISPPCSEVKKAINKSANKQGDIRAGSELKSARKLSPLAKPKSAVPPIKKLTTDSRRIADVKRVRRPPLMPSNLRSDEETIERLIHRYAPPHIGIAGNSRPYQETIERLIHRYAPHHIAHNLRSHPETIERLVQQYAAPLGIASTLRNLLLPPYSNPFNTPISNLHAFPNTMESNFTANGNFDFPSYSPPSLRHPPLDLHYHKSLIEQYGERHDIRHFGEPGYYMQGQELAHNNTTSVETNQNYQKKPCVYFTSPKGCRNGYNCLYQHDVPKRWRADELPVAKRFKCRENMMNGFGRGNMSFYR